MIDLHVDFILLQRLFGYDGLKRHRRLFWGQPFFWHADIPRMLEAGYHGACLGVHYWPWESPKAMGEVKEQVEYLNHIASIHPDCMRIFKPEDWHTARANKKLGLIPGVEGSHVLDRNLDNVAELARLDVAYLTLTHFSKTAFATPSMGLGANEEEGLTELGKDLVRELERHDILVDLAHVNTPGVLDACAIATKPMFCTHTGVDGVHKHARNISDEEIDAIAEKGGVIGMIFAPSYMTPGTRATSKCVLDHLEYVVDRVGIDYVAIGSDFDGWLPSIPSDMRDCRDVHVLFDGMRKRGFSEEDIRKVRTENAFRILSRTPLHKEEATEEE